MANVKFLVVFGNGPMMSVAMRLKACVDTTALSSGITVGLIIGQ